MVNHRGIGVRLLKASETLRGEPLPRGCHLDIAIGDGKALLPIGPEGVYADARGAGSMHEHLVCNIRSVGIGDLDTTQPLVDGSHGAGVDVAYVYRRPCGL